MTEIQMFLSVLGHLVIETWDLFACLPSGRKFGTWDLVL